MNIIRAEIGDTDVFSKNELDFGACCFFTEDRAFKYFFEINGQEATLFTNFTDTNQTNHTNQYVSESIEEFLFYSGFVLSIKDKNGCILAARTQNQPYMLEISKIQPSQFYINEKKLESCMKWIKRKSPEDIFIPIVIKDNEIIALDGHTRLRAALDLGYTSVFVYPDEYDDTIFYFSDEAVRRQIRSVSDMEIVSDEEYKLKWNKYCDDLFDSLA